MNEHIGFNYNYNYNSNFYSDETGTVIGDDLTPVDDIGSWDAEPHTFSETFHVRPPGEVYGAGDGSSWTNAFSGLPDELIRGARYLVAAGEYYDGPWSDRFFHHVFDHATEGEQYIGVFKATPDDHGSEDGWEPSMGQGQARFGPVAIITGYLVIDGRVGISGDNDAYGISITARDCENRQDAAITFPWNCEATNVSLRHLDVGDCGHRPDPTNGAETAIYSYAEGVVRFALKQSYIHDAFRTILLLQNSQDIFIEGNTFARAGLHHESATLDMRNNQDMVIRRNVLIDSYGVFIQFQRTSNVHFHGNVLRRTLEDWPVWAAIYLPEGGSNVYIYNNTFYNLDGLNTGVRASPEDGVSNLQVVNNLWAGSRAGQIMLCGSHEHNAFFDNLRSDESFSLDELIEESTKQILTSDPFVNGEAGDLRLVAPTESGRDLGASYQWDLAGVQRGMDGVWDRGAYEYND